MKSLALSLLFALAVLIRPAAAQQEVVWLQIEAHPSLRVAQERARLYAGALADVNGFSLGGNWYGIVLGPYTREDAEQALRVYKSERQIPQDAFIAFSSNLGQQFWPVGANVLGQGAVPAPGQTQPEQVAEPTPEPEQQPEQPAQVAETAPQAPAPVIDPESVSDARRSESLLSREERMQLQVALQAAGFYNAAIDGAFGRGTRGSMAEWQGSKGLDQTGVLTTMQRQMLMDDYNAPLISVGMAPHRDAQAGIAMDMPMGEVAFARYEPPFAHYDATGDMGARVLQISQPGTQATLYGLYDIMQTLEIVPLNGPRERGGDSFTIEGRNGSIVSYTQAALENGQIKGFTLIWPTNDEPRRNRVLAAMKASFARTEGVLDPAAGGDAEQNIDLISGLEIRKPRLSRSGFFIDTAGTVVTTTEVLQGCTRLTADDDFDLSVVASDDRLGVAVLKPNRPLAPLAVAALRDDAPRLQSDIAVSGFSYGGVLGAPTLTFGTLADIKGLQGETELARLALNAQPGDAGGPVIDISGGVVGMLLPAPGGENQQLPANVSLAADATALRAVLDRAGIAPAQSGERGSIPPAEMNRIATGMTVLISCWD
ncbi:serine protease [Arenibacterium halophilum]|uniref:Peptidoglycan-binding protein n=1 Tax=Arenibacterium halophilum TaxID=2583821 RepID=A0ABY2XAG7_9RHOB|nr:serine protease [Arenibacterium halophilum]TMV12954.1 peptidoglycan-binding protein [Arenibacterium halophilum]